MIVPDAWAYQLDAAGRPDLRQYVYDANRRLQPQVRALITTAAGVVAGQIGEGIRNTYNSLSGSRAERTRRRRPEVEGERPATRRRLNFGERRRKRSFQDKKMPVKRISKKKGRRRKGGVSRRQKSYAKKKINLYAKYGSEHLFEYGSVASAGSTSGMVDHGHYSSPLRQILRGVFRCLVRMLCKRTGWPLQAWSDNAHGPVYAAPATHRFVLYYRVSPEDTVRQVDYDLELLQTWDQVATNFMNFFLDTFGPAAGTPLYIQAPILEGLDYRAIASTTALQRVSLIGMRVTVSTYNNMRLQNRTAGVASTETEADDVTNNPVKYKMFEFRGNKAMLTSKSLQGTASITGDEVTGDMPNIGPTDANAQFLESKEVKHLLKSGGGIIAPGGFIESKLSTKRSMRLDALMGLLSSWIEGATSTTPYAERVSLGTSRMFQFDKLMDTRVGTESVKIGYQINGAVRVLLNPAQSRIARTTKAGSTL